MPYFPMLVDLQDKPVLIVGGGAVALRKVQKLLPYGVRPTVVAPEPVPRLAAIPGVALCRRGFAPSDLRPRPALVVAAAGDREVNRRVSELCREQNIPVNVADDPALCSFLFPALVQEGDFSAGISTGGASPAAAAYFKERLREQLPENLGGLLSWLKARRPLLKAAVPERDRRAAAFRRLFEACMAKGAPLTEEETERAISGVPAGSVALVGAGCGRADLITLRGLRLLRQCQAVVYDGLIDPALLDAAPESALRIYVGKRSGSHAASQREIEEKLIELARSGLQVVRLKGGDPYLFGRGGEEMLALTAAGIPCREVPGIPSAIGIPAEAGIPVTHRGVSRGVHIVTAHTAGTADGLPEDFGALAGLSGTLVFLMGLQQLPKIVAGLMAAGKDGSTPAAVISGGSAQRPALVRAPLSRLEQAVKDAGVSAPAVIVIGDVAAMDLSAGPAPLRGLRVGVTGTRETAGKQLRALAALGAETEWVVRFKLRELPIDWNALAERDCWMVFTSANGVNVFFRQAARQDIAIFRAGHKFAVIGEATGAALKRHGICAGLCPKTFTSQALGAALAAAAKPGEPVVLLRSAVASAVLPEMLREAGLEVRDVPIYDLEPAACAESVPKLDYLTFSSSGGVKLFFERYGAVPEGTRCVCIGGVTAQTLSRYTEDVFLTASEISAAGIVERILRDRDGS